MSKGLKVLHHPRIELQKEVGVVMSEDPTLIELQKEVVASCFNEMKFWQQQYESIKFSTKSHKEKKKILNCLNSSIKEYCKAYKEMKEMEEKKQ